MRSVVDVALLEFTPSVPSTRFNMIFDAKQVTTLDPSKLTTICWFTWPIISVGSSGSHDEKPPQKMGSRPKCAGRKFSRWLSPSQCSVSIKDETRNDTVPTNSQQSLQLEVLPLLISCWGSF